MSIWLEVWRRPGDPNFGVVQADVPFRDATIHDAVGDWGDGSFSIPDTFDGFDDILVVAGTNSVASLVRVRDDNLGIVFEWLPSQMVPTAEKEDPFVEVSGRGIKEILGYAVTGPFGWLGVTGALAAGDVITPNWQFGADNMLGLPGMEDPEITPKTIRLVIDATGGTYTLTDGTDTTSAIAFNAQAAAIQTAIETELGGFVDVIVALVSTSPLTHLVQLVNPPFGVLLGIDDSGLTGPNAEGTTETTVEGGYEMAPWERARALVQGLGTQGFYNFLGITDNQAHSGTFSLGVDPGPLGSSSNRGGGIQQVLSVVPGGLYQASVWVYPTNANDEIRFAIFSDAEAFIATNTPSGETFTPNQWTQIVLSDIVIPANVNRVIFRVQNANSYPHSPSIFYVDDAEFYPGLPAATPGVILRLLYESYTDPTIRTPIVWDDGSGADTPYLTLDFTDSVDSGGNAWSEPDVHMEIWMRMTFWDVLKQFESMLGLECRVVVDDENAGTWLLQVYNDSGMDAQPAVAVHGGAEDTRRQIRRFRPPSWHFVEGEGRIYGIGEGTDMVADFGRMETARLDRQVVDGDGLILATAQDAEDAAVTGLVWSYELTDPEEAPLTEYLLGDTVTVHDPPEADGAARLWEVTAAVSPDAVVYDCDFYPPEEV